MAMSFAAVRCQASQGGARAVNVASSSRRLSTSSRTGAALSRAYIRSPLRPSFGCVLPSAASAVSLTVGVRPLVAKPAATILARHYADTPGAFLKDADVEKRVIHVVSNFGKVDAKKVNRNSHFINDLGLDSLDEVELLMAVEDEFCIEMPDSEVEKLHTVDDVIKYLATHPTAK